VRAGDLLRQRAAGVDAAQARPRRQHGLQPGAGVGWAAPGSCGCEGTARDTLRVRACGQPCMWPAGCCCPCPLTCQRACASRRSTKTPPTAPPPCQHRHLHRRRCRGRCQRHHPSSPPSRRRCRRQSVRVTCLLRGFAGVASDGPDTSGAGAPPGCSSSSVGERHAAASHHSCETGPRGVPQTAFRGNALLHPHQGLKAPPQLEVVRARASTAAICCCSHNSSSKSASRSQHVASR
jgi:hypothetical protein